MYQRKYGCNSRTSYDKYMFIFSFIYEWQSVGVYGIPAIPTL